MKSLLRIIFIYPVLGYLLLVLCACNGERSIEDGDQENPANEILQTGKASWYGPGFDGRLTSSRERFDKDALTAAHRTLPFDTIVEVVNTENNKSVEVRINDRGPYAQDRIIDLSKAAAEDIDMLDRGVAEVELFLVEAGATIPENLNHPTYTIQVGEYNLENYAEQFAESIGDGVRIEQRFIPDRDRPIFMIYYGNYNSIADAREELMKLEERGFEGLIRQIN
ncbi:septal ring lytic transglycosylase RlpA family protein [Rhodohalobacter sp.]|uniref:septal ring lytic transglycosylase RlpA family protein n=1 Tax=Rhodohalobacter sp. TaxID=1974210 RepID=UPI002ACE2367|nr:septal ring lytic transglycosylase RlpA family protein [Rhodohalobacter sp.]MDZ7755153.1 septal ring lytic transglycosylase RlpA family protein [Rhodohalobacter sp.]